MRPIFLFFFLMMKYEARTQETDTVLIPQLLAAHPELFSAVLSDANCKEVQVLYTQVNRDKNNLPHFKTFSYRLDDSHYFYPASTVKLAAAIFALEKLNALKIDELGAETPLHIDSVRKEQVPVTKDETAASGMASISHYIKKILLVSDNDAFNRLFEFIGRATINQKLKNNRLDGSRILNRLAIKDGGENARHTNPITFVNADKIIYQQTAQYDPKDYPLNLTNTIMGKAYLDSNDQLVNQPFDLSNRNAFPLSDQQALMKKLIFPTAFPKKERFNLTEKDYDLLYRYMSMMPTESTDPKYDSADYFPAYGKFLFYGQDKNAVIDPNIRIFNKIGDSYGFLIDNMYFVDYKNNIEFFLSAVVQSNNDGIYNDGKYEYQTVCFPFMKNLGQIIYRHELERPKKHLPDLSAFAKYK